MKFLQNFFFGKDTSESIAVDEKSNAHPKTLPRMTIQKQNALVEEIHQSFYCSIEQSVIKANAVLNNAQSLNYEFDKLDRLRNLGFDNSEEKLKFENFKYEFQQSKRLLTAIEYFNLRYPFKKLINEDGIKAICAKYGLVYGRVHRYKGRIPEKNLREMEEFISKVHLSDRLYITIGPMRPDFPRPIYLDENEIKDGLKEESLVEGALWIAAPLKDMIISERDKVVDFKIEIPDPVVFLPVHHEGFRLFIILTAWGVEASDELVVNQKFN